MTNGAAVTSRHSIYRVCSCILSVSTATAMSTAAVVGKSAATTVSESSATASAISTTIHISTTIPAVHISVIHVSATGISAISVCTSTISTAIACAKETSAVKPSAVKIAGISLFKKRAVMGVVPIIPIVAVPGREVVIGISGELVFINHAVAAGIAIRVDIGTLISIGFLVCRSWCGVDRRRRNINTGSAERKPEMGAYVYLCIALSGDQQACSCQRGECKDLFHIVSDFTLHIRRETGRYI